jgi:hypothetical protein
LPYKSLHALKKKFKTQVFNELTYILRSYYITFQNHALSGSSLTPASMFHMAAILISTAGNKKNMNVGWLVVE